MIRGNKIQYFLERELTHNRQPITADIFLTNYCNLRCSYCRYKHNTGEYMSYDNFVRYVEKLLSIGVKSIILTGGGEPTINPDFNKITTWLENNKIPYGINTNLKHSIECNPVFIKISIDTGDNSTFKSIRGCDALDSVINNVKKIVEYKKTHLYQTNIGVQCVATTQQNVISFYNRIKDIDVDYIYFRPLETTRESPINSNSIKEWLSKINDERINVSYKFELKDYKPKTCIGNWSTITINHKGDVPYCCHKPNEIVGNIMDDDILIKKELHQTNMSSCEHPCRLSGVNHYLQNVKIEKDIYFI